jgi:hypothetical protein
VMIVQLLIRSPCAGSTRPQARHHHHLNAVARAALRQKLRTMPAGARGSPRVSRAMGQPASPSRFGKSRGVFAAVRRPSVPRLGPPCAHGWGEDGHCGREQSRKCQGAGLGNTPAVRKRALFGEPGTKL